MNESLAAEIPTWPYVTYAACAVILTVGLAFTLHRHGKVFLSEVFSNDIKIAKAVNSLLVTGFFMLNLGYAFLISRTEAAETAFQATENLIQRLGALLLSLGLIHFVNMAVFWKIRRNLTQTVGVPVASNAMVPPPPARIANTAFNTPPPPKTGDAAFQTATF